MGLIGLDLFGKMGTFPLLAVVAFVLTRRNEKLVLATVLASLSTLANVLVSLCHRRLDLPF